MIFGPTFIGMRSGSPSPLDADAVTYAATATTMTAANLRKWSDWYKSLKGEAGYWEQLDANLYDNMVEGWGLRGDFNLVTGDEDDAMSTALGMKLTHSLAPNALYWGDRGTRFFGGSTARVLATSGALLPNGSEWSVFAVVAGNGYGAANGAIASIHSGGAVNGRTINAFMSTGGVFGSFSNHGSSVQSFTNVNSWGYEPRTLLASQTATQILIHDNGSETPPSPQTLASGVLEQTPFRVGNIGGGNTQFNGIIYDVLLFNTAISGANYAKMHRNYNRIFGAGLKDSGTLRPLPNGNYTSQVKLAEPGTTGLANYLGTPALIQQGDNLIASCDHFGSGTTAKTDFLTSTDLGATWTATKTEAGMFWGGFLDIGDGALYMLGTAQENGNLVIKKSVDAGLNWTTTTILTGTYATTDRSYLIKGGYLYVGIERVDTALNDYVEAGRPRWTSVIKVDITTDLMTAGNWSSSNELDIGDIRETIDATATSGKTYETLEHNIYEQANGDVVMLGRTMGFGSKGSTFIYDTGSDILTCTGGDASAIFCFCKSGQIRCPTTGKYLVIGNKKHDDAKTTQDDRTALWWFVSETGESGSWAPLEVISDLGHQNLQEEGLQYPSQPVIIGDDIYFTVRAAWNGANDYHNANRILFWRKRNYVSTLGL